MSKETLDQNKKKELKMENSKSNKCILVITVFLKRVKGIDKLHPFMKEESQS